MFTRFDSHHKFSAFSSVHFLLNSLCCNICRNVETVACCTHSVRIAIQIWEKWCDTWCSLWLLSRKTELFPRNAVSKPSRCRNKLPRHGIDSICQWFARGAQTVIYVYVCFQANYDSIQEYFADFAERMEFCIYDTRSRTAFLQFQNDPGLIDFLLAYSHRKFMGRSLFVSVLCMCVTYFPPVVFIEILFV